MLLLLVVVAVVYFLNYIGEAHTVLGCPVLKRFATPVNSKLKFYLYRDSITTVH